MSLNFRESCICKISQNNIFMNSLQTPPRGNENAEFHDFYFRDGVKKCKIRKNLATQKFPSIRYMYYIFNTHQVMIREHRNTPSTCTCILYMYRLYNDVQVSTALITSNLLKLILASTTFIN